MEATNSKLKSYVSFTDTLQESSTYTTAVRQSNKINDDRLFNVSSQSHFYMSAFRVFFGGI